MYDNLNRLKTYGGIVMDYDPKGILRKKAMWVHSIIRRRISRTLSLVRI